jgi:regulator of replication initiation timing
MKEFLKKSWAWILSVLVLTSVIVTKTYNEKIQKKNVEALQSELTNYKLKDGTLVASNKSLLFENEQLNKSLSEKDKELANKFSEVKTVTKIQEVLRIDTIKIVYKDSIKCNFRRVGNVKNKSYSLNYITTQKGIKLSNIVVPDTVTVITGKKRKWFLGKETETVDVLHSNVLIKTEDIKHIENTPKKKWYDTNLFKIGVGFIGGAIILK